jgi:3',5'-cyclic AMP phosphodiesterase CpdA
VIPLVIKHVTDVSAIFFFELRLPQECVLVYRSVTPGIESHGFITIAAGETRHMITIEGLTPGVRYQTMVLVDHGRGDLQQPGFAGKEWGMVSFNTESDRKPIRVGVLGDASFGDEATYSLIDLMASQDLDFIIHTGDVVYETNGSDLFHSYMLKFFEPFSSLLHQLPVYTVLGNHDYDAVLMWQGAPFYDYAFPAFPDTDFNYPMSRRANQYYAFSYRDVQFLMLDSQVFFGVEGRADQDTWLKKRLADTRFRFTIPIFHVAPFSSCAVHPDDSLPVRYSWVPLFESVKIPISFSGHFHAYERLQVNGVTYVVTGGGSSTLYAQGDLLPESLIYAPLTHFVLMEIFEDRIQISAITKDGERFDQATIPLK